MGIALWLILSIVVGVWASRKGRSGFGWFVLAILFSPLLAGLFLAASKNLANARATIGNATQVNVTIDGHATHDEREEVPYLEDTKACPRCAERVKKEALVCRFCGHEFDEGNVLLLK